ncbi:hypothetical protein [uncultured Deinococcus sp.]|uniref:hypothetical protein n=1 Tax=uncultured Deinococcus sp. TaxID=158789 RepID=UPI002589DF4E|nr:hypothetical protein [uncultured Deinococcus sp.]
MNLKTVSLLSLTCLLASCGRTPEAVTPPVAATPSALYELHFQNLGSAQTTASAQRLGAGLGAQRLENAPEPLALGTTPLSTLEFVTTENGKSVRHAQATFKLTNTSGRTLKNLVFLPVALNDTDGDPSNNAQAPTAGGTPFRTVRYFDGSDASALAGTLTPVQGQRLNAEKTGAQADPDADAYFRGLSTAGLNVAAPAGLSVQVTDGGWLAATSLAAGASTNVTFAVDMDGVDPANLKATPYSFSLLVTGGEDATATDISSSVDPASIQGVLPDWKYGEGRIVDNYFRAVYGTVSSGGVVGGTIYTPALANMYALIGNCSFKGTQTASDVKVMTPNSKLTIQNLQGDELVRLNEKTLAGEEVIRLYAESAAVFRGVQSCSPYPDVTLDLDLKRGWNALVFGADQVVRNLPFGTRTVLGIVPVAERVDVTFTDAFSSLDLVAGKGEGPKRGVLLNQVGAISGDVTLETDVPGVTVTPATLSLPNLKSASVSGGGLGALGLGTQALTSSLTFSADAEAKAYSGSLNLIVKKGGVEVGRGRLYSARVVVPAVSAYFTNSLYGQTGSLAQGETRDFPVALSSVEGYAGTTTVTLSGLPAGVSASTETVTLTANGQATATIKLTVGPGVAVGTLFDVQATGPKITTPYNPPQRYIIK